MIAAALFAFAAACLFVCSKLRSRRAAALFAVAVFLILTFGVPYVELAYKCAEPRSEGCVWGKSLLPVTLAVGAVIGLVFGGVAYLMALGFQRRRRLAGEAAAVISSGDGAVPAHPAAARPAASPPSA